MVLHGAERGVVLDLAGRAAQATVLQLHGHEHVLRHVVFAPDAEARGRGNPKRG